MGFADGFFTKLAVAVLIVTLAGGVFTARAGVEPPDMTARSVFVMNAQTGQVLYEKNADKVFRMLSLRV